MKLQEFVSETLREIIAGVKEAQAYAKDNGAMVNPRMPPITSDFPKPFAITTKRVDGVIAIKEIDFDVAVTSTDSSETQAGAGIFVAGLGLGVKDKSDTVSSSISRIKFSVPMALPTQRQA
jgi:hypothetical protein